MTRQRAWTDKQIAQQHIYSQDRPLLNPLHPIFLPDQPWFHRFLSCGPSHIYKHPIIGIIQFPYDTLEEVLHSPKAPVGLMTVPFPLVSFLRQRSTGRSFFMSRFVGFLVTRKSHESSFLCWYFLHRLLHRACASCFSELLLQYLFGKILGWITNNHRLSESRNTSILLIPTLRIKKNFRKKKFPNTTNTLRDVWKKTLDFY